MAEYGVTPTGFKLKRQPEIIAEMASMFQSLIKEPIDTDPESVTGQMLGIFAYMHAALWEVGQASFFSQFPATARGASLDEAVMFTGVRRQPAKRTRVRLLLGGGFEDKPGTVIPAGSIVRFSTTSGNYISEAETVLGSGGQLVWFYRENVGPEAPEPHDDITIVSLINGWVNVYNPEEASAGRFEETDDELVARYRLGVHRTGAGFVDAIYANLVNDIQGIISAQVYHNPKNVVDADNRPAGSVEAVVYGGNDQEIADKLLKLVSFGIDTYGNNEVLSVDSQGYAHKVRFSRPMKRPVWLQITIKKYEEEIFPDNAEALIKSAIMRAVGPNPPVSKDVIPDRFKGPIYGAVAGIEEITVKAAVQLLPVSPIPGDADYLVGKSRIGIREVADYAPERISVSIIA